MNLKDTIFVHAVALKLAQGNYSLSKADVHFENLHSGAEQAAEFLGRKNKKEEEQKDAEHQSLVEETDSEAE